MKVGLSLSRCVRDIFEGKVDLDDVLVVIARTKFHPLNEGDWEDVWDTYTKGGREWSHFKNHELEFKKIVQDLFVDGKLHQPRMTGGNPVRRSEYWLETFLPPEELEIRPAVKEAWQRFQIVAELTSVEIDKTYK